MNYMNVKQTVIQNRLARPQKNQCCCVIFNIPDSWGCFMLSIFLLYLGIQHTFLFIHREGTTSRKENTKHDEMIGRVEVVMEVKKNRFLITNFHCLMPGPALLLLPHIQSLVAVYI